MKITTKKQHGFAVLEGLLIIVIIAIIGGTGWYVMKTKNNTDQTYSNTVNQTQAPAAKKTATSYFTIKEWGVKAPYSGTLHLSYKINNMGGKPPVYAASVTSSEYCAATSNDCAAGGGTIIQATASTVLDRAGTTPTSSNEPYVVKRIGNYYYVYIPNQDPGSGVQLQTESTVKTLVSQLAVSK